MRRIAYVTDLHLDESFPAEHHVNAKQNWQHVLDDIKNENITHIVVGGDIGETSCYPWFFDSVKAFSFQLTLGNHDSYSNVKTHLNLTTSGSEDLFYHNEDDTFKFLFVDTSSYRLGTQQMQWLGEELRTEKKVVLFMHHPVLEVDTKVDQLHPLQNRGEVKSCLVKSGREITIFCGHYHLADEQHAGNIRQIISPAVSFQMMKSADQLLIDGRRFGYRVITFMDDGTIKSTVKMFESTVPDTGVTVL